MEVEQSWDCYILFAAGYAETSTRQAKLWLEREGIRRTFLGLKSGSIPGATGGAVPAEALISRFSGEEALRPLPDGLLVAGGSACGRQLLADPRVHFLIQQMEQASKPVGFLYPVSHPFVTLLQQQAEVHRFLLQEEQTLDEFMNIFGQRIYQARAMLSLR